MKKARPFGRLVSVAIPLVSINALAEAVREKTDYANVVQNQAFDNPDTRALMRAVTDVSAVFC
jgi:hypothetical protein